VGKEVTMKEYVMVLNDIEKQLAEELIQKFVSGVFPTQKKTNNTNSIHSEISYEYSFTKNEKVVRGMMLDCPYKLRYRDSGRVYFSAWDCFDVSSVFYDVYAVIYGMYGIDFNIKQKHMAFEVDLNTKDYTFCTGPTAVSITDMTRFLTDTGGHDSISSQYLFSVFGEASGGIYAPLIENMKESGYSEIHILQIWIRGEIFYYVTADGAVLRSGSQRALTGKEERDVNRKIYKATNSQSSVIDFHKL
jgi:hypothetical protein